MTTVSGTELQYAQVPITIGGEALTRGDNTQCSASASSAAAATTSAASGDDDGGLSGGAKIGIGVGLGLFLALLVGSIGWFLLRRRRIKKASGSAEGGSRDVEDKNPPPAYGSDCNSPSATAHTPLAQAPAMQSVRPQELDPKAVWSDRSPLEQVELPDSEKRFEVDATPVVKAPDKAPTKMEESHELPVATRPRG